MMSTFDRLCVSSALALCLFGCDGSPRSDHLSSTPEDPTAIQAEVQRVFDDAACYCESYELLPYDPARGSTAPTALRAQVLASGHITTTDPRLTRFVQSTAAFRAAGVVGPTCELSSDAARGAQSRRTVGANDAQMNACAGTQTASITRALCRAEIDQCLGHELRLAADSSTRPLPGSVRREVLEEAERRFQLSATGTLAELERLRMPTVCTAGSTDVDCQRVAGGFERTIQYRVAEATSAMLDLRDELVHIARVESDRISSAQVEGGGLAASGFGPDSPRAAILTGSYGLVPVVQVPPSPTASEVRPALVGAAQHAPPRPANLAPDRYQGPSINVFLEQAQHRLAAPLTLSGPGAPTLPAGTVINVYLLHYDPIEIPPLYTGASARLDFDRSVQGVLTTDAALNATDATLGMPGMTYPTSVANRGMDASIDQVVLGSRSVTVRLHATAVGTIDQLRVVTLATPDSSEFVVAAERAGDLPRAARSYDGARAQRVVDLLARYEIRFPHSACVDGATGAVTGAAWSADPPAQAGRMYEDLEVALRAETSRPPRTASEPHLARTLHEITAADIADAIELVRDLDATFDGLVLAPPDATCGPSILHSGSIAQRSTIPLMAAFARTGGGVLDGSGASWYQPTVLQLLRIGSLGAVQIVRQQLARGLPRDAELAPIALDSLSLIDAELGAGWTEWSVCSLTSCDGDVMHSGRWSLFERIGTLRGRGVPVLVASASDVRCLLRGSEPLAPAGATCEHVTGATERYQRMTAVPASGAGRLDTCLGGESFGPYCRRSFTIPDQRLARPTDRRFVMWCVREDTDPAGACRSHELVDAIYLGGGAQVHAFGGDTGAEMAEMLALDPMDPAMAMYNSLGFQNGFVPPLENELTEDGDATEDSWSTHLASAERSAANASGLLQSARQHELEQLAYERSVAAQLESAALAQQETVSELCGAETPDADCSVARLPRVRLGPSAGGVPGLEIVADPGPAPDVQMRGVSGLTSCADLAPIIERVASTSGNASQGRESISALEALVKCSRWHVLMAFQAVELTDLPVAAYDEVLASSRGATNGGNFSEHGAQVRRELIALFQSLEDLRVSVRHFETLATTTAEELKILRERFAQIDGPGWGCFFKAAAKYMIAAVAIGAAIAGTVASAGAGVAAVVAAAGLAGALLDAGEAIDQCGDADNQQRIVMSEATVAVTRGLDGMMTVLDDSRRAIGTVAIADSRFDDMQREIELAQRRRDIAERLATSGVQSDPTWYALLGVERRRADDALDRAQRYAYVARRAIEVRLAVDMTTMSADEPYVAAPAFWVNDVFDLASAVEYVDIGGNNIVAVDVRAEALPDYLDDLRAFVDGYPISHRFSEGDDQQVINLAEILEIDPALLPPGSPVVEAPLVSRVLFQCRNAPGPLPGGLPAGTVLSDPAVPLEPCGVFDVGGTIVDLGGVDHALFSFTVPTSLDGGYFGDRLAGGNYNYRVRQVALNLVGRALFDCEASERPSECYGDGNVQFSMRHQGATVITNWDGEEHLFAFEPGVITRARALADERWLTNPLSGSDTALLAPYMRSEWWGRPLAGTYTIEVHDRAEMDWRNLENVQVLLHYHYWTRQR